MKNDSERGGLDPELVQHFFEIVTGKIAIDAR